MKNLTTTTGTKCPINTDERILPNCGMVAGASAAGVSVERFTSAFKVKFRKGPSWKGRAKLSDVVAMINEMGVKTKAQKVQRCSLTNWCEWQTGTDVGYIVRTGGHFQYVLNNMVTDQFETQHVSSFHRNRKIVTHAFRVL